MDLPLTTLAAFAITSLIIELTPGPNMVYLAILTLNEGRRAGFSAVAGVTLGLLILGIIAALGLSALVMNSPALYQLLRWGGVFYLLWLAWDDWHDAAAKPDRKVAPESNIKFFGRGLITNLLNPKAGIFYIAVLPNFVDATRPIVSQTLFLSAIFIFIATTIHTTIVMLAGTALPLLEDTQQRLLLRRASSLALAAVAVWLAWSTRR